MNIMRGSWFNGYYHIYIWLLSYIYILMVNIIYIYIYIYIYISMKRGDRAVMVTVIENGNNDTSSNPGQDCI